MLNLEEKIEIMNRNIEFLKSDIAWMKGLKKSIQTTTENKVKEQTHAKEKKKQGIL